VDILIDNQPYPATDSAQKTIRQLAQELCAGGNGASQRVVTDVRCNGEAVPDERLEAVLEMPAGGFERLEFQTRPVGMMVKAALTQAIDMFEQAASSRYEIADLLGEGQYQVAMQKLQTFFEAWRQVQQTMLVCSQATATDLDVMQVDGVGLADILSRIKQQLLTLKEAIEAGDLVVTGDILRYELDEPFTHWIAFLNQFRIQTAAE
jgi:hypothetical protein